MSTSAAMSPAERARFLQALQDDPEFRAEVRNQLLSRELLELPERFAQFAEYVNAFIDEQRGINARFDGFIARQDAFNARVETFIEEQQAFNANQLAFNARQEAFNRRTDVSIGILKGNAARRLVRDHAETILDQLRLDFVQIVARNDLIRMARQSGLANEVEAGERRSFYAADLVLEGIDADGNTRYVAAEASFTADRRDTDRARRNAQFLTRCTGQPAQPIIASVGNDREVAELVDAGAVGWFQLEEREFEAD